MESNTTYFENKIITVSELIEALKRFNMSDPVSVSHDDISGCLFIESVMDNRDFGNDNTMAIIHFNLENRI